MDVLKVSVTKSNIQKGVCHSTSLCPIARAVRGKGFKRVNVNGLDIQIGREGHGMKIYELPRKAQRFVMNFDDGLKVNPITFVAKSVKYQ